VELLEFRADSKDRYSARALLCFKNIGGIVPEPGLFLRLRRICAPI
jgi:hypothetical protein